MVGLKKSLTEFFFNGLLLHPVSKGWLIFKSCLFLRLSYVYIFAQKLAYFEKKHLFQHLSIWSCFYLCPELGNNFSTQLWWNVFRKKEFLLNFREINTKPRVFLKCGLILLSKRVGLNLTLRQTLDHKSICT